MLRHLFKIIWNERKSNTWLVFEYIIIFCVLWFCSDYIYTMVSSYYGSQGFDINHTYSIDIREKPSAENEERTVEIDRYALAMTFLDRIKRHPDIESVSLSNAAIPYGGNIWMSGYKINTDSINHTLRQRFVTSSFFDVFNLKIEGRIFDWQDDASKDEVIISPFRNNSFGSIYKEDGVPFNITDVRELHYNNEWDAWKADYRVIGTTAKMRDSYFDPFYSNIILPLKKEDVKLSSNQIAIRVKPSADHDFIDRFTKDMREQFFIGPYYLSSITSFKELRKLKERDVTDKMNSSYAIALFLVINVFLGILGSFWFRIQARRSEIGLRIALGASKQKIQKLIILETLFLLIISSIIATIICLSLSDPEIIHSLGIPTVDKESWGIDYKQNIINFILTFGFLAIISIGAVWYPAKQASNIQPAEALHNE